VASDQPLADPPPASTVTIVFVTNNGKTVTAPENSNLLRVSLRQQGGIPFKCGAGICGTCRCKIESGIENTDKVKQKERKHLTDADLAAGYRMACQTFIAGDVSVSWIPLADRKAAVKPPAPVQEAEPVEDASTPGAGDPVAAA
jgi:ferredoxin